MHTRAPTLLIVLVLTFTPWAEARAQWDVPSFLGPRPSEDIGVYLSDLGEFSIQGIWRQRGNMNLGLRIGYIDGPYDGLIAVGTETWGTLARAGGQLPVDVTWTAGVGAVFNGGTTAEVPVGLSIGRRLDLQSLDLQLYAHPRLALLFRSGGDDDDGDTELDALFDLGADLVLSPTLTVRLAAALGGTEALGVGVAYRWTRGAVVR